MDTKFMADMFIVQKEYRKAFSSSVNSSQTEGIIKNQTLLTKIEE